MVPRVLEQLLRLVELVGLQQQGADRVRRILDFRLRRTTSVHPELAVGGRVEHLGRVREQRGVDAHFRHHPLDDPEIAQVGLEAGNEVELAVLARCLVGHGVQRERAHDALEHVVPAGDVRTDEGRRVRKGHRELVRHVPFLLGVVDEGIQVVADHLGHGGRRYRDHFRLVDGARVLEAVEHVLLAAEDRGVFGHRIRDAADRLLEVAIEIGAEIRDAALRAMHVGQRLLEA